MSSYRLRNAARDRDGDITYVGDDTAGWNRSRDVVGAWIANNDHTFYVDEAGYSTTVQAIALGGGRYTLRTTADRTSRNNLDNLPPIRIALAS